MAERKILTSFNPCELQGVYGLTPIEYVIFLYIKNRVTSFLSKSL